MKATTVTRVLITGASSGIGAATALFLAECGLQVWGTTRSLGKVKLLPVELQTKVKFIMLDVTDDASVRTGIAEFFKQAGGIEILINNAGRGDFGPVEEYPLESARGIFETNYFGTLRVIKQVLPKMREARQGLIINITSLAGKFVIPFQIQYSASKFALEALTEGLRQELRPFGITAVAIEPGDIKSNFNEVTEFGPAATPPYQRWTEACWRMIEANMKVAPPPEVVARKIWRIIKLKKPRTRYAAGDFLSVQFPWILRLVSDRVKEAGIRLFYNINFKK
jgi:NAD(P)-dependent dehydrogenase (short-subunit alcohol dehydrogenase family)